MSGVEPTALVVYLASGAALGTVYFALLLKTVRLHAAQAPAAHIVPLYVLRFAAAGMAFWIIAKEGAFPVLLALSGFLIARSLVQRRMMQE